MSFLSNPRIAIPVLSDSNVKTRRRSVRWISLDLNVYILSWPFHNRVLSSVNEEVTTSGTFLKWILKSFSPISLGIDFILILGIMVFSSDQKEWGLERNELLTSLKYSLFLSVIVFLISLYFSISTVSFLLTANSWTLSLSYIIFTISRVIKILDLTFNWAVFVGACVLEICKKASFHSFHFTSYWFRRIFGKPWE